MKTAVVLSGGGARGAYEVGVLWYVLEKLPGRIGKPIRFDIVSGSSVGAIHACFLASFAGEPGAMTRLAEIWRGFDIGTSIRLRPKDLVAAVVRLLGGRMRARPVAGVDPRSPVRIAGLFDVSTIEHLVLERIDWPGISEKISSGVLEALAIAATRIQTGHTTIFVQNRSGRIERWARDPFVEAVAARIGPEHAMASAAIPFFFPVIRIDGGFYCDGSLRLNTPLSPALRLGAERVLVIGVHKRPGGESSLVEESSISNPAFLAGKVLDALLLDRVDYDADRLRLFNAILEEGCRVYGEDFLERINEPIVRTRGAPYRIVRELFLRPSRDLGVLAAECYRHMEPSRRPREWLTGGFLRFAARNGGSEADLLSYFLFDGCYASHLMELGIADAERESDRLAEFFS